MPSIRVFNGKIIIVCCVLTCISTSALSFGNRTRLKRQVNCGFICSSRECINRELVCDGHEDCQDGDDEANFCKNLNCTDFYFRCNYGGCVPKSKICNGQTDCRDNSDESSCNTNSTFCRRDQFECRNGQCIASVLICNGLAECLDKSDETQAICSRINCPSYTYRCDYGACISTRGKCNGIQDCLDNSDEDPRKCSKTTPQLTPQTTTTTTTRPSVDPNEQYCPFPIAPKNGFWEFKEVRELRDLKKPTENGLPDSTVIYYKCKDLYKLTSQGNVSVCVGNKWEPNFTPKCLITCPAINQNRTRLTVKCYWNGEDVNCLEPVDGTIAVFTCKKFYELKDVRERKCINGSWNLPKPECQPIPVRANISISNTHFPVGGKISLPCEVQGFPIPQVQWYKDGILIKQSEKYKISEANTLSIHTANITDSGSYQCQAANLAQKSTSTVTIVVDKELIKTCMDNPYFANCKLIIASNYCTQKYYAKFCCGSCMAAGLLKMPVDEVNLGNNTQSDVV